MTSFLAFNDYILYICSAYVICLWTLHCCGNAYFRKDCESRNANKSLFLDIGE